MHDARLRAVIREILDPFEGPDGPRLEAMVSALEEGLAPFVPGGNPAFQAQLREIQKMEAIGQLTGGIAKDFKNLSTIVSGNAELALQALEPGHPARRNLQEILEAGGRTREFVDGVLAFSRQHEGLPTVIDLSERLAIVGPLLRRVIPEDIEITTLAGLDVPPVRIDPVQLEQAILSLVVNARDAMPEGGRLVLQTAAAQLDDGRDELAGAPAGSYAMLAITDSGVGMDDQVERRIFEPFFTTKMQRGTGLGLATVEGIVTAAGGHIIVSSKTGHGTSFRIYLPASGDPVSQGIDVLGVTGTARGDETILVVEDEPAVRKVTVALLEKLGYSVFEASNGQHAIARSRSLPALDLLLTDMVMPVMSGGELIRHFRVHRPDVHVLCMSGYAGSRDELERTIEQGVTFLQKPFSLDRLAAAVREAIDGERPRPTRTTAYP